MVVRLEEIEEEVLAEVFQLAEECLQGEDLQVDLSVETERYENLRAEYLQLVEAYHDGADIVGQIDTLMDKVCDCILCDWGMPSELLNSYLQLVEDGDNLKRIALENADED